MPDPSSCPELAQLERLVLGQVTAAEAEALEAHVLSCPHCSEALGRISAVDPLVEAVQARKPLAPEADRDLVHGLIDRLKVLYPHRPADAGGVTAVELPSADPSLDTPVPPSANRSPEQTAEVYDFLTPAEESGYLGGLGGYRVRRVLGTGGMGVVFLAEDPQLQRPIALKAMQPGLAANADAKTRFLREARAAAALKHDHIVGIYQVGEDRGTPYLAMEFLDGESLEDRLRREAKLPLPEVLRIGREIAEGLEAAHENGLVHRDIKPGNIWLEGKRGRVKILDFGLARTSNDNLQLTQSGAIVGTPAYMPPEQARGEKVDARCDLYSLGCVLYQLSTGQLPFQADNLMSLMMALATQQPRSPREINPDLPPALVDLIVRLLGKDPAQRPANAREVADALDSLLAASPANRQAPAPPRRRRVVSLALAGGFVLAALLTVIVIRLGGPEEGTVTIETVDPDVELVFTTGGREYTVRDKKTGEEIKLPLGSYQVALKGGKEGLKLETNQFVLKRGERPLVKVTRQAGTPPADARSNISPPVQIPEPPPLEEWLKGRKVLTVAQDGSGQFKTIQAALDALESGQVIKVLDRGPYHEQWHIPPNLRDAGLISEQQSEIQVTPVGESKNTKRGWGIEFPRVKGFRLNGLCFTSPWVGPRWTMVAWTQPSGLVVENCCFRGAPPVGGEDPCHLMMVFFQDWGVPVGAPINREPLVVRHCAFSRGRLTINDPLRQGTILVERNSFRETQLCLVNGLHKGVIQQNIFASSGHFLWLGVFEEVSETLQINNNTALGLGIFFHTTAPKGGIILCNNILGNGFAFSDGAARGSDEVVKHWEMGHNYLHSQARFLSLDPAQPDYSRTTADNSIAWDGAGGAWPRYVGALPPGPAPKEGDWFTRLRQRWGDLAAGQKAPTAPPGVSPLDALDLAQVPASERFPWQPKELVAVIGTHRQRHGGDILDLDFSPDGATVATAGKDGHVRFWDTATLEPRGVSEWQFSSVYAGMAYVPAGPRKGLVWWGLGHPSARVRLLDPRTGRLDPCGPDWALPCGYYLYQIAASGDGSRLALTETWPELIRVWDVGGEKPRALPDLKSARETPIAFAPGSSILAYRSSEKEVRLVDLEKPDRPEIARLSLEQPVLCLAFARNGKRLAVGEAQGRVTLWDLADKAWTKRTAFLLSVRNPVHRLAFSNSGKQLAVSGFWNSFPPEVWDVEGAEPKLRLRLAKADLVDLRATFTPDDRGLITTWANLMRRWRLGDQGAMEQPKISLERLLEGGETRIYDDRMIVSADGRRLAARTLDGKLRLWDLGGPQPREYGAGPDSSMQDWPAPGWANAFSPEGTLLATWYWEPPFTHLWDTAGPKPRRSERYKSTVNQEVTAWSSDGKHVYAFDHGQQAARLHVLDGSGPVLRRITTVETSVDTREGVPMRNRLSAGTLAFRRRGGEFTAFEVWDVSGEQPRHRFVLHQGELGFDLALSPDGKRVACAYVDKSGGCWITLWDVTGAKPRKLESLGVPHHPRAVCFMPDGERLVWSELSGRLVLWDFGIPGLEREWTLPGPITQIFVPRDGRHLITYNGNGTIYVLRLAGPR
jgi:serine/threonine protein kinase/WD40 repeat protein